MTANDDRIDDYLAGLDTAADWTSESDTFPLSFDEWNALRLATGQQPATRGDYLDYLTQEK